MAKHIKSAESIFDAQQGRQKHEVRKVLGAPEAGLGWRKESTQGNIPKPPEHNSFISRTEMLSYLLIPNCASTTSLGGILR